jgi:cellulose synthase/poly-beta-1,6-N-acetylglucosamine synthase-like glycosyltransferase
MSQSDDSKWMPSVSVIIPAYNNQLTIEETLQSIKNQNYQGSMEIIVVDDGSSDRTPEIAQRYTSKVIRQTNKGPGVARNRGAREAVGEILVFTDSDCVLSPQFISELVRPLQDSSIAGSQGRYKCNDKALISRFVQYEYEERARRQARVDNVYWIATHSACYRRDVFLEVGGFYEDSFSGGEDLDLSQRMTEKGFKMVFNPEAVVYHHHPSTLGKYIISKFARAYWMVRLYQRFPDRIIHDPITPALRKLMMVFMVCGVISIGLAIIWSSLLYLSVFCWVLIFLSTLPFTIRILFKDPVVAIIAPEMMLLRTAVFIAGFAAGYWAYLWKGKFEQISW